MKSSFGEINDIVFQRYFSRGSVSSCAKWDGWSSLARFRSDILSC